MNTEQFFRAALQDLADEGNMKAKVVLSMAKHIVSNDDLVLTTQAASSLKLASSHLMNALSHNELSWTKSTDRSIASAQTEIINTLAIFAR
jgi:CMP-N-acetylneuraminic acid synthetase